MSRSYKKYPLFRDNLWGKSMKRGKQVSNRKIRRKLKNINNDVKNGRDYLKFGLDRYDMYEFKNSKTKQEIIDEWNRERIEALNGVYSWRIKRLEKYSLEDEIFYWYKSFKMK